MAFHEIRLPDDVERGAIGGPMFKTRVLPLESGYEQRNQDWDQVRGEWDIAYGLMQMRQDVAETAIHVIRDFFYARAGRAHGFRFKDWSDFEIGNPADTSTRQLIGLGDDVTTTFQTFKRYSDSEGTHDRTITKIVDLTPRLWFDATEKTEVASAPGAGEFSVDDNTGIITTGDVAASTGGTGPGGEEVVSLIAEFDVPVRFDTDFLQLSVHLFNVGAIPALPIKMIRPILP
jgi:uncharacterized protein (TIGR02217 family)